MLFNMTESSERANLANTIRGLKKFDGRNPAEFKTWMKKLCVVISVTRRDILPLLKETARPTHTSNISEYNRANEDLYAMLFLLVELPASLCVQTHENDDEISGDGQAAFKELCNIYYKVTDEVFRATMEELVNTPMEPGQNPDDYFNQKRLLRIRAEKMGEHISDRYFKDLKTRMREFKNLSTPREITTAGKHTLHGIGTGIISFTIRDNHGTQLPVNMRALVVPGLGRNIFAPTAELRNGVSFVLEKKMYLTIRGTVISLKQYPRDQGMCSLDITFQRDSHGVLGKSEGVSPDSGSGVAYTATTSASVWHRRLGHMNPRNMEVLRSKKGNGVEYTGNISGCDICSVTKSKQQAHPKQSTRKTRPMQLVYTDLMGPFTPAAKGGYRFVSKFTDDYSRMKEIFLLKNKTEAADSLHQYNMTVAAPLGLRIENLRCHKGGEYTGQEFRTLCVGAGINIEYTATNTPQQNGVSERDGQTLAKITRCLMKDGDFPPFMWVELMFTATYLANKSPHSTLEGATPYSEMHNLEPDLTGLRAIGARAFVHRETYTKKLEDRAFEGKLCGYSHNSKAYRIYNPAKGTVVESRNVTFLETPAYTLPPDVTTEDYHYEEDVLRFTSVLDSSLLEEDLFTPNCDLSSAELEGQVQRLRQEVRRLSKINAAQSPSPSSTPASPGVAVDQRDAGTREPEPASPSINQ